MAAGCSQAYFSPASSDYTIRPTIGVMKFENRAPFPLNWNLGDGMQEILVDRLVASGKFQVIERPELDSVLSELKLQQSGSTRQENRAILGRLKNVQYLVKGTITDFGHVINAGGFLNVANWDILGRHSQAVMGMTLYVVDVESGEIICSQHLQESIRTSDVRVQAVYKDVALGGSVFYRTPLGKATAHVIDKAVKTVAATVASRPWEPKVAMVSPDGSVIVNGGRDRGVAAGQRFEVVQEGQAILDPDTGDMLGRQSGTSLGVLEITAVHDRYSVARCVVGQANILRPGTRCVRRL